MIPPLFSIDEGYGARINYEQQNQNTGVQIIAVGLAGLGIIAGFIGIQLTDKKKSQSQIDKLSKELNKTKADLRYLRKLLRDKKSEKK